MCLGYLRPRTQDSTVLCRPPRGHLGSWGAPGASAQTPPCRSDMGASSHPRPQTSASPAPSWLATAVGVAVTAAPASVLWLGHRVGWVVSGLCPFPQPKSTSAQRSANPQQANDFWEEGASGPCLCALVCCPRDSCGDTGATLSPRGLVRAGVRDQGQGLWSGLGIGDLS